MLEHPRTIAIAGAWGYIGRKVLDAALELGLEAHVLDPGPPPLDLETTTFTRHQDDDSFYALEAGLFHLALHPEHRAPALERLLARARLEPLLILNEKPMAEPERPDQCAATIEAVAATQATMMFDFLELFDPMTHAIVDYFSRFDTVTVDQVEMYRGKDREDPERPRNYKKMVHIQYQESVHCLAFLLNLLGALEGGLESLFDQGLSVEAASEPYAPPNPEAYPFVVDGRCEYTLRLGQTLVQGLTDFKSGAPFSKRKVIRGTADGTPFVVEADHLEGSKYLRIDDQDQGFAPDASAYRSIIGTLGGWYQTRDRTQLMQGVYPNPRFARYTYQLSSVLWRSCYEHRPIALGSARELVGFKAGFAAAAAGFARYAT